MTKSEIIYVVMGHAGVRKAEVDESIEPGSVTIRVSVDPGYGNDDIYDLRSNIIMSLEPRRPAGVGFEVVVKRDGEVFVAATAQNRFAAVAAELTAYIAPVKKPPPPLVEKPNAPQLFEQIIEVAYGIPSPCPQCKCQAFTPDENRKQAACRGCPLPSPLYSVEYQDKSGLVTRDYKCSSCGAKSVVSLQLRDVNLYCWGCKRLAVHELQWEEKKLKAAFIDKEGRRRDPGEYINQVLGVPIPVEDPSRDPERASRILKGSKAVFTFQGVEIGEATNVEITETFSDSDVVDAMELYKDLPPGKGYEFSMMLKAEDGQDWFKTIAKLSEKVSAEYGMTYEQLAEKYVAEREVTASPAAQLIELFRKKLGLQPFALYEQTQRNENITREGIDFPADGRNRERRTGRTTKGLLQAIAQFVVSDKQMLCVVGSTERYTRDLWRFGMEMIEKINLARRIDIRPIMPSDFDERYDYGQSQRALVYVDHSYTEKLARYR